MFVPTGALKYISDKLTATICMHAAFLWDGQLSDCSSEWHKVMTDSKLFLHGHKNQSEML